MNNTCYSLKEYTFDNPIFNSVDATYIIHLEGNGRLNNIKEQLKYYHPTKIVYILFNKGFKKCEKDKRIDKPPLDLIDAFFQCFKDAYSKNYGNILILEDDFIFDKEILNREHSNKIDIFLNKKSINNENYIYCIGTLAFIESSFGGYHNRLYLSGGAHSCIYSKEFIKYISNNVKQESIFDWDYYCNLYCVRYIYYKSLCYQIFPETDNSKLWDQGNFFLIYWFKIIKYNNKKMKLDIQPQPGFDIMKSISHFMYWFIIITFFLIIFYFIFFINTIFNRKFNKNKRNNNFKNFYLYLLYFVLFILIIYPIIIVSILLLSIYIKIIYHNL